MSEPRVTRIRVEYEDGSFDNIDHLPQDETAFYDLRRERPVSYEGRLGLHTGGAIASILFLTALHGRRREYSVTDPEIQKLCKGFFQ